MADILAREEHDDACLRDSISIASTDSFVSAAEVREAINHRAVNNRPILIINHQEYVIGLFVRRVNILEKQSRCKVELIIKNPIELMMLDATDKQHNSYTILSLSQMALILL